MPPNWTDPVNRAPGYVYLSTNWTDEIVNNTIVLNHIIGHPNGGHVSLTDGGILLGNSTGAIQATAVLAKGSLLVGSSDSDPAELVVQADNTYLTVTSTATLGLAWRTPIGLTNPEDIMKYA